MRSSTKHAIAQRLLALLGFMFFVGPMLFQGLGFLDSPIFLLLGWIMFIIGIVSAWGVGPWGRYFERQYLAEHDAYLQTLEPKQPWQH